MFSTVFNFSITKFFGIHEYQIFQHFKETDYYSVWFWSHVIVLFVNKTTSSNTNFVIIINGLITDFYDCPKMALDNDFGDMQNLRFSGSSRFKLFFLILLALIICYKNNKRTKLYHDRISIRRNMLAQIWIKMSVLPIFGSYPFFEFLP